MMLSKNMPSLYAADVQLGKPQKISGGDNKENEKPKRTLSEETKQKLKEARERKKQERLEAAKQAEEAQKQADEAAAKAEADKQAKKEAAALKRKETRLKRKAEAEAQKGGEETTSNPDSEPATANGEGSSTEAKPKAKRQRKAKSPELSAKDIEDTKKAPTDQPPQWFTKFVTTIMTEKKEQEGVKATKKELKAEGEKAAEQKWADSYTRDRIRNAVDGHLGQMYSMIFR